MKRRSFLSKAAVLPLASFGLARERPKSYSDLGPSPLTVTGGWGGKDDQQIEEWPSEKGITFQACNWMSPSSQKMRAVFLTVRLDFREVAEGSFGIVCYGKFEGIALRKTDDPKLTYPRPRDLLSFGPMKAGVKVISSYEREWPKDTYVKFRINVSKDRALKALTRPDHVLLTVFFNLSISPDSFMWIT